MRKLGVSLLVHMLVAAPALATNGMRMTGFGAVQDSMGGVGVGTTLDACSMVSNPAGLPDLGERLDVAVQLFKPNVDYRATEIPLPPGYAGAIVAQPNAQIDSTRGATPIPSVAYVRQLEGGLALGLGAFGVAGMGVDEPANLYGGRTYSSYLQGRVTPSVGYRVSEMFSLGLSVNAMLAQVSWDVAKGFGQMPHDTSTALGIGATVGVKFTPMSMLSLGAAYESRSFFNAFSFDIPAHPNPFNPSQTIPASTDKLLFDQPQSLSFGFSVAPLAGIDPGPIVIGADVQWINWSQTNGLNQPRFTSDSMAPNGYTNAGTMPWNLDWHDQWVFKVGAQVEATRGLRVRAGWNYGKMPLDENRAFENIAFPAVAEHHITAGLGYDVTRELTINVGGMYAPKASISGANANPPPLPGVPPPYGQGIASYTAEMSQWSMEAGIAWKI